MQIGEINEIAWLIRAYFRPILRSTIERRPLLQKLWGTPQNFFLAFIDELEKQIIIKKTVEVGQ